MTRPICKCGNLAMNKGRSSAGTTMYRKECRQCHLHGRREKGTFCELCSFIPKDPIQLDVDHIDGDPTNNDKSNLQTICANCHRLKTKLNNDWTKRR